MMESDGLAIYRCISGNFDRNSWRHPGHHRVVPIRTIAGALLRGFTRRAKSMTHVQHPIDARAADPERFGDSASPHALSFHLSHSGRVYRGRAPLVGARGLRRREFRRRP